MCDTQASSRKTTRDEVIQMDRDGEIKRNFTNVMLKDTIMLPDGGYVVTRFKADNPGR